MKHGDDGSERVGEGKADSGAPALGHTAERSEVQQPAIRQSSQPSMPQPSVPQLSVPQMPNAHSGTRTQPQPQPYAQQPGGPQRAPEVRAGQVPYVQVRQSRVAQSPQGLPQGRRMPYAGPQRAMYAGGRPVVQTPLGGAQWLQFLKRRRSVFSSIGWAVVMCFVVFNVVGIVLMEAFEPVLLRAGMSRDMADMLLGQLPLYVVAMPMMLLIFRRLPVVRRRRLNMGSKMLFTCVAVGFPIAAIGGIVGALLSDLLSNGGASNRLNDSVSANSPLISLVVTTFMAPIFEEWIFRKEIIDHTQQYGELTSILFSSVAFGLFHTNMYQFFYATALGMVFGYVYVRTGKLRYTIGLHMAFNFFGGALPILVEKLSKGSGGSASWTLVAVFIAFELLMFILGIVLPIVNRHKIRFYRAPQELPFGSRLRIVFGNSGVLVGMAVLITFTFAELWV